MVEYYIDHGGAPTTQIFNLKNGVEKLFCHKLPLKLSDITRTVNNFNSNLTF